MNWLVAQRLSYPVAFTLPDTFVTTLTSFSKRRRDATLPKTILYATIATMIVVASAALPLVLSGQRTNPAGAPMTNAEIGDVQNDMSPIARKLESLGTTSDGLFAAVGLDAPHRQIEIYRKTDTPTTTLYSSVNLVEAPPTVSLSRLNDSSPSTDALVSELLTSTAYCATNSVVFTHASISEP